jgi:hypothetical protein
MWTPAAEYDDFDISSFSESWLNSNHTDQSIKLLNFHTPFRSDRGPHKMGNPDIINIIWITKSIKTAKYDILSSTTSDSFTFIFWQTVSDFDCFTWGDNLIKKSR